MPRFGSDTTRAILCCEGRSGVIYDSIRPQSLHKIKDLETGKKRITTRELCHWKKKTASNFDLIKDLKCSMSYHNLIIKSIKLTLMLIIFCGKKVFFGCHNIIPGNNIHCLPWLSPLLCSFFNHLILTNNLYIFLIKLSILGLLCFLNNYIIY